ncbi:MAG: TVP38/TMEM64 family protein [Phycisphaerales bacterium]
MPELPPPNVDGAAADAVGEPSATVAAPTGDAVDSAANEPGLVRQLGWVGVLAAAWAFFPGFAGGYLVFFGLAPVSDWLRDQGGMGVAIFIAGFAVTAGFGLLPTYAQAVLAGWVFGATLGIPAALVGFTGAAIIGFFITQTVARARVEHVVSGHPRASIVRDALIGRGFLPTLGIVSLIRIPPNSPFSLTNLLLAGVGVRFPTYVLGTVIGMTPRTAIVAVAAASAAATGADDIVAFARDGKNRWLLIGGVVLMIFTIFIIGRIANRALERAAASGRLRASEAAS